MTIVADVTVNSVGPSEVPPGFGFAPRGPAFKVESANITVHVIKAPNPFITSIVFNFRGVNPIADAYDSRNTDAPDALSTRCRTPRRDRPSPAACGGTPIATPSPTSCCSTR